MLPTLRQLQYLTQLAQHGSFSRAAEAAHVTQPTLSAGVQELERVLGGPVVDRARGGVILTPAGVEAVTRARDILTAVEDLVEACRGAALPLEGRLRLGVIPTVAPFLLPRALGALRSRHPRLRLFLREDLTHRLIADLKAGQLDLVLIALPYDVGGLEVAHIRHDELLAALPLDHPLAGADRTPVDALAEQEIILLEGGHCLRDHALAACRLDDRRSDSEAHFAATSLGTLMQMVGSGLGVSLVPALAVEAGLAEAARVAVRPLAPQPGAREIVMAWRAGSARGAEARLLADLFGDALADSETPPLARRA
ncbi:MAG: hydrogen peroxide-inducible genes activator [Alphaproteobacteria bacterium]|jgi:LysR family hydrogen peroxide-inducible transcriptional activator|nr:hydrogen peroxide-inducible genes activator [Alphaproteobacteria bacterium]